MSQYNSHAFIVYLEQTLFIFVLKILFLPDFLYILFPLLLY